MRSFRWFFSIPLRQQMLAIFMLATLVPIVIIITYDMHRSTISLYNTLATRQGQLLGTQVNTLQEWLIGNETSLLFLAESPSIRRYVNQLEQQQITFSSAVTDTLSAFIGQRGQGFVQACLIAPDGTEFTCLERRNNEVAQVPNELRLNRFDDTYFLETLSRTSIPGDIASIYLSNIEPFTYRAFDAPPIQVMHYAKLLQTDDGFIGGVLLLTTSIDAVDALLATDGPTVTRLIVAPDGHIVTSTAPQASDIPDSVYDMLPIQSNVLLRTPDGVVFGPPDAPDTFLAYTRFRPEGQSAIQWTLVHTEPLSPLIADIRETQRNTILIGILSLIGGWGLELLMSYWIVSPLNQLTQAAQQMKTQMWDTDIPHQDRKDEIGTLAEAFQVMANEQQNLIQSLNVRIEELEVANSKVQEQNTLFQTLDLANRTLSQTLDLDIVLVQVMQQLRPLINYDSGSIILRRGGVYRYVTHIGLPPDIDKRANLQLIADIVAERVERANYEAVIINDIRQTENWVSIEGNVPVRSWMGVPLVFHGELIGVINFDKHEVGYYTSRHARYAMSIAAVAAPAIENAILYEELRHRAETLEEEVVKRTAELAAEKHQNELILYHVDDAILFTNANGSILYANPAWERISGYRLFDVQNESIEHVSDIANQLNVSDMMATLEKGRTYSVDFEDRRKDGTPYRVDLRIVPIFRQGVVFRWVAVFRDVTELHRVQEMKDRLISHAAHELRTPVTVMLTKIYLMRRKPERLIQYLDGLEEVTQNLKSLVENLLDTSRLERGAVTIEPSPTLLQTLVQKVLRIHEDMIRDNHLTIHQAISETPITLMIDEERIQQVITNLVTNAIRYTPQGGDITVTLEVSAIDVQLQVKDNGMGIPASYLPDAIFEPFVRVNTNNDGGTGLGLAISRDIARLHGGDIHVTSKLGEGSTFTLTLPLNMGSSNS